MQVVQPDIDESVLLGWRPLPPGEH